MKLLLLLIALILTLAAKSQTSVYHTFPDSAAVWSVAYDGYEAPTCYDRYYYIAGDTTINSFTYHKIAYFGWNGFPNSSTRYCDYWHYSSTIHYLGAIRQDTSLRKVYFIIPGNITDTLLYDFNLNLGDTLPQAYNHIGNQYMNVQSIDSILIGTNYRKRFNLSNTVNVSLIEGIGSTSGLIEDFGIFEQGGNLTCFSQNNKQLYPDTMSSCELLLGNVERKSNTITVSISPNPFHTVSLLKVSDVFRKAELKIYNSIGMQVRRQAIISKSVIINREGLSNGIYFYHVSNDTEQVLTGKFVID